MNTAFGGAGGGLVGLLYSMILYKGTSKVDLLSNGVLAGLVGVTAGASVFEGWASWLMGCLGGLLSAVVPELMKKAGIDDPVGAVAVHGAAGALAVLGVGIFGTNMPCSGGVATEGLWYSGDFTLLWWQFVSVVSIAAWSIVASLAVLLPVHFTVGMRVTAEEERIGIDRAEHGVAFAEDLESLQIEVLPREQPAVTMPLGQLAKGVPRPHAALTRQASALTTASSSSQHRVRITLPSLGAGNHGSFYSSSAPPRKREVIVNVEGSLLTQKLPMGDLSVVHADTDSED